MNPAARSGLGHPPRVEECPPGCAHAGGSASLLGPRVYDLRHTRLTNWLNHGVPPPQVEIAWRGGRLQRGVIVLLRQPSTRCVRGVRLSGQGSDQRLRARVLQPVGAAEPWIVSPEATPVMPL
ncbi:hypothetical protein GCM10010271_15030 [Streptomyces kurssanovii]|nr:hypothetical protein GCM10010271_15030 [Streptomyces kurssanovii]